MAKETVIALKPTYYRLGGNHAVGAKFVMESDDVPHYVKEGLVAVADAEAPVQESGVAGDSTLEQVLKQWEIKTPPDEYLKKFPNGPHSELALRILELQADEADEEIVPPVSTAAINSPE